MSYKGPVMNYGEGGLQNGKISGLKRFAPPPPPQDRVKLFAPPPPPLLKGGNFLRPPPSVWLKLHATVKKLPKNYLCHPSAWLKLFPSPLFVEVKLPPPSRFVAPPPPRFVAPPLPVISDQSLTRGTTLWGWGRSRPPPLKVKPYT